MKNLLFPIIILCLYHSSFAQKDSSLIFEKRIAGNGTKTWFPGAPAIIDVPRDKPQKSFTFKLKPKTAKWILPRGRDLPVVRDYATWSIKKQPDSTYLLLFPRGEKYSVEFKWASNNSMILLLTDVTELRKGPAAGVYFEKKFSINPIQ